jgi:hypothetical protein
MLALLIPLSIWSLLVGVAAARQMAAALVQVDF